MWLFRVFLALQLLFLHLQSGSAATHTDWQNTPLGYTILKNPKTFPDLMVAWDHRAPHSGNGVSQDKVGLALQLAMIFLGSFCAALLLPQYSQKRVAHASRAAREISRIRWTIARNPFERWDDK